MTATATTSDCGTLTGLRQHTTNGTPACEPCLRARRRYDKLRRLGVRKHVDAKPVWKHIQRLRKKGLGINQVARLAGMAPVSLWRIQHQEKVRVSTARKIMAIREPESVEEVPEGVYVSALGAQRRLLALAHQRWSIEALTEHTTLPFDTLWRIRAGKREQVRAETFREVVDLYERIGLRQGTSRLQRQGIPAAAWDNIDDPSEEPKGLEGDDQ